MISSNFGKRLRLLVFLNVEQETLQEFPNLSVVSPPFVAKTRLRNPKPEKKEKEAGSSTWRSPLPVLPTGTPTTGSSRPGVVHDPVTYQVSALVQRLVALEKRVRELAEELGASGLENADQMKELILQGGVRAAVERGL